MTINVTESDGSTVNYAAAYPTAGELAKTLRAFADAVDGRGCERCGDTEEGDEPGPPELLKKTLKSHAKKSGES